MEQTQEKPKATLREGLLLGPQRQFKLQSEVADMALGKIWHVSDLGPGSRTSLSLIFVDPALVADTRSNDTIKKQINAKLLKHQHLLDQQGFFQLKNGWLALTWESLDGLTLQSLIDNGSVGKLKPRQLKALLGQVAVALDFMAKTHGHAHGALCPELIFINRGTGVKLAGQGLRPALDGVNDQLQTPLSYPQYQAPEAFHPGNVSAKSDTYSLGCIAYQILTGERPYVVGTDGERSRHHDKQPRHVSDRQWLTLQRALSEKPEERPTSAPAMIQALFVEEKEDDSDDSSTLDEIHSTAASTQATNQDKKPSGTKVSRAARGLISRLNRPVVFAIGLALGISITLALQLLNNHDNSQASLAETNEQESPAQQTDTAGAQTAQSTSTEDHLNNSSHGVSTLTPEQMQAVLENPQSTDLANENRPSQTLFRDMIDADIYGPEMVVIPAGRYSKGDDSNFADDNEKPAHEVHIQQAFGLSRYEVTFDEYDQFAKATNRPLPPDEGWGRGRRPVINVTWQDAYDYTQWLAEVTGEPYRLPTESEWEYASRAGSQSRYSWGEKILPGYANCDECGSQWSGQQTAPVGSLKPNPWGLYDMAGNVDEWVADCYADNYVDSPTDGTAASEHGCSERAMRGGSWFDIARLMRPSSRYRNPANGSRNSWGFRIALDINPRMLSQ